MLVQSIKTSFSFLWRLVVAGEVLMFFYGWMCIDRKGTPLGQRWGGSIPSHIGALVVVRSMPSTQEYSRKRAIFASFVPGHSLLPKNLRVASSWHACWPWHVFFTNSSCSLLLSSLRLQLYRTLVQSDELDEHWKRKCLIHARGEKWKGKWDKKRARAR